MNMLTAVYSAKWGHSDLLRGNGFTVGSTETTLPSFTRVSQMKTLNIFYLVIY